LLNPPTGVTTRFKRGEVVVTVITEDCGGTGAIKFIQVGIVKGFYYSLGDKKTCGYHLEPLRFISFNYNFRSMKHGMNSAHQNWTDIVPFSRVEIVEAVDEFVADSAKYSRRWNSLKRNYCRLVFRFKFR